ncbi:hypothetical protein J6590_023988 [Homalodisca vitripennis]|nr:hypothetical protein J6590_023988 [Homalodisca vitripennis]
MPLHFDPYETIQLTIDSFLTRNFSSISVALVEETGVLEVKSETKFANRSDATAFACHVSKPLSHNTTARPQALEGAKLYLDQSYDSDQYCISIIDCADCTDEFEGAKLYHDQSYDGDQYCISIIDCAGELEGAKLYHDQSYDSDQYCISFIDCADELEGAKLYHDQSYDSDQYCISIIDCADCADELEGAKLYHDQSYDSDQYCISFIDCAGELEGAKLYHNQSYDSDQYCISFIDCAGELEGAKLYHDQSYDSDQYCISIIDCTDLFRTTKPPFTQNAVKNNGEAVTMWKSRDGLREANSHQLHAATETPLCILMGEQRYLYSPRLAGTVPRKPTAPTPVPSMFLHRIIYCKSGTREGLSHPNESDIQRHAPSYTCARFTPPALQRALGSQHGGFTVLVPYRDILYKTGDELKKTTNNRLHNQEKDDWSTLSPNQRNRRRKQTEVFPVHKRRRGCPPSTTTVEVNVLTSSRQPQRSTVRSCSVRCASSLGCNETIGYVNNESCGKTGSCVGFFINEPRVV